MVMKCMCKNCSRELEVLGVLDEKNKVKLIFHRRKLFGGWSHYEIFVDKKKLKDALEVQDE